MAFLTASNGPVSGQTFELDVVSSTIGRAPECEIQIEDYAVSRRHARIIAQDGGYYLEDLKSRNRTYLNDEPVEDGQQRLRDGDRVTVCDVVFVFRQTEKVSQAIDMGTGNVPVLLDGHEGSGSTIMSKLEVTSHHGQVQLIASPEVKLHAMMEIMRALGKAISLDNVLPTVLDSLFKIFVQADRAFIGLRDASGVLVPRWSKARREDSSEAIRISRTIINRVMELKEAVVSADAVSDQQFQASQSIADFRIRSMMCAPLFDSEGEVIGVIQVDTIERQKQFKREDLEVLVSVAAQAGIAIDNANLHEETLIQREVQRDLELAHEVQRDFLPDDQPKLPGYLFHDYYQPANHVGGDYYDYVALPDDRVAVIVADVVGHGVAAALLMAKFSAEMRFSLAVEPRPDRAVRLLNERFSRTQQRGFVTMIMTVIDPHTNEVTIVNAGHMPPVMRRSNGEIVEPGSELSGIPIGIEETVEYEQHTIQLEPGELLVLYTDGLNEACNTQDEQYGIDRIHEVVSKTGSQPAECGTALVERLRQFQQDVPQEDDMCLVVFARSDEEA